MERKDNNPNSDDKKQQPSWFDSLPDDYKELPSLTKFKNKEIKDVVQSYLELQSLIGRKGVIKPGENGTPEQWEAYYNALGRPESPDAYELSVPEEIDETFVNMINEREIPNKFKQVAHQIGLTNEQTKALYEFYVKEDYNAFKGIKQQQETTISQMQNKLKEEYGIEYDTTLASAKEAAKQIGIENVDEILGKDYITTKALIELGKVMSDDISTKGSGHKPTRTPEIIQKEINEILASSENDAFYNMNHPDHEFVVARYKELHEELAQHEGDNADPFASLNL